MGPKIPEIEYINLDSLKKLKHDGQSANTRAAYEALLKLASGALTKGTGGREGRKVMLMQAIAQENGSDPNDPNVVYVRRDGERNPDIKNVHDQEQLEAFAENLKYLTLGYFLLEKEEYALHAVDLINAFFVDDETRMNPDLNYGQVIRGRNNPSGLGRAESIISVRVLAQVVNVLPLLESFGPYAKMTDSLHKWFQEYLHWLLTSPVMDAAIQQVNNIHTWYTVEVAAIQNFLDPTQVPGYLKPFFANVLPNQINKNTGDQPFESARTKPLHYLIFNLDAVVYLAEIGRTVGLDFYHQKPQLIRLAADHIISFVGDTKEDITEAVRVVQIVANIYGDRKRRYQCFVDAARHSKDAENISGPENALAPLWSDEVQNKRKSSHILGRLLKNV
ncbi:hypothetical protein DFQ29_004469 [Apophysomyces sp. BC1021]|nr:hypothetical protein DFQ29_004469 [Apophysomyces sp. BC1021]